MKKTIKDFDITNKTIILRCDLNVSIKDSKIIDNTKIIESLKTINYILDKKAKLVILSHLGKIKTEADKKQNSLELVYKYLNELIPNKIKFIPFTSNKIIKNEINNLLYGEAILLENTRFEDIPDKKESNCNEKLSQFWASLGDIFINDAFGTIHRKHASNYGISKYLDSGIGFLMEKEIKALNILDNPMKPFTVIMGGSKISDKIKIIEKLIQKVDYLLVGGAMAFTLLKAKGYNIGNSLYEEEYVEYSKRLLKKYNEKIILPVDFYGECIKSKTCIQEIGKITNNFEGLDIGKKTQIKFKSILKRTNTVFWNGPLGKYEITKYQKGTKIILKYIIKKVDHTIIGGGDIVGCTKKLKLSDKISYASTGGGATLEYIVNKNLPGLENIKEGE